jgi:uncharacterized protein
MNMPGFIRPVAGGVTLAVKVQPRASENRIVDASGEELRVRVTAPPVDSAANEALVRFLAKVLQCPRNNVELLRGNTSRRKVLKIHGLSPEMILAAVTQYR